MNTTQRLPLSALVADTTYQPRTNGLDRDNLERLEASDPATWPALLVSPREDGRYVIIDGYHRYEAARRLQMDGLDCIVLADGAGYPEAVEANLRHGLPLSSKDRKLYARWLHEQDPSLSFSAIGRKCGLSDKTVKAALSEQDSSSDTPKLTRRDPVEKLIELIDVAEQDGIGRGVLGRDNRAKLIRKALEEYDDDVKPVIAASLDRWGTALIDAARPYVARAAKT